MGMPHGLKNLTFVNYVHWTFPSQVDIILYIATAIIPTLIAAGISHDIALNMRKKIYGWHLQTHASTSICTQISRDFLSEHLLKTCLKGLPCEIVPCVSGIAYGIFWISVSNIIFYVLTSLYYLDVELLHSLNEISRESTWACIL